MTIDEALAQADLRVRVVSEGNPFYDIHAAVMSDEALAILASEIRRLSQPIKVVISMDGRAIADAMVPMIPIGLEMKP